jgi:hypothetical protein
MANRNPTRSFSETNKGIVTKQRKHNFLLKADQYSPERKGSFCTFFLSVILLWC